MQQPVIASGTLAPAARGDARKTFSQLGKSGSGALPMSQESTLLHGRKIVDCCLLLSCSVSVGSELSYFTATVNPANK